MHVNMHRAKLNKTNKTINNTWDVQALLPAALLLSSLEITRLIHNKYSFK
jgi:hypothetical protein